MPIQFRCTHCGQLMSISRRKAGEQVTCPMCVHRTKVPDLPDEESAAVDEAGSQFAMVVRNAPPAPSQPPPAQDSVQESHRKSTRESVDVWKTDSHDWGSIEADNDFQIASPDLQESGLDMTPMVDVTFLLLIFFMITASFSLQKSLETTPPDPDDQGAAQTVTLDDLEEASVVVEIDAEDRLRVDDVPVAGLGELVDVLTSKIVSENKTEMLIEADPAATHGMVVAVTDAGMDAQMQRIRRSSSHRDQ